MQKLTKQKLRRKVRRKSRKFLFILKPHERISAYGKKRSLQPDYNYTKYQQLDSGDWIPEEGSGYYESPVLQVLDALTTAKSIKNPEHERLCSPNILVA